MQQLGTHRISAHMPLWYEVLGHPLDVAGVIIDSLERLVLAFLSWTLSVIPYSPLSVKRGSGSVLAEKREEANQLHEGRRLPIINMLHISTTPSLRLSSEFHAICTPYDRRAAAHRLAYLTRAMG